MANAVEELFASNAGWVEGLALRWAQRRGIAGGAADDYASVAAVALWEACRQFDGRGVFRLFVVQRVRWALASEWRRIDRANSKLRSIDRGDKDGEAMLLRELPACDDSLERLERRDQVERVMQRIPAEFHGLVKLVFVDGMTLADAGCALGHSRAYCSWVFKRLGIDHVAIGDE